MPKGKKVNSEKDKEVETAIEKEVLEPIQVPEEAKTEPVVFETARYSSRSSPTLKRMPNIVAGVCEYCGPGEYDHSSPQRQTADWTFESTSQLGRCKHYNGYKLRCSFCPQTADWKNNVEHRKHIVYIDPENPKQLLVVCDDMGCASQFFKKYPNGVNDIKNY